VLKKWIETLIYDYTHYEDFTFEDLKELSTTNEAKELYLIGANLSTGYSEIFSYETTPNMKVVDAVRISMSLPFFFSSVKHKITGDIYVDGGLFDNYPIDLFDDKRYLQMGSGYYFNSETIGFKLESSADLKVLSDNQKPERKPINNFSDYIKRLVSALLNNEDNKFRGYQMDKERTIIIDSLDIRTTDFELSDLQKTTLFDSGYISTKDYLKARGYYERI
jgi:NTE family protein